jgi:hypothetical protein
MVGSPALLGMVRLDMDAAAYEAVDVLAVVHVAKQCSLASSDPGRTSSQPDCGKGIEGEVEARHTLSPANWTWLEAEDEH